MDGYDFPVYTTKVCPRNESEWHERSSAINCNKSNGYMCMPNEDLTELLEFCYIYPFIWIQEDVCMYLYKKFSRLNAYNCVKFRSGCPKYATVSSRIYEYPSCSSIQNGCFVAEPTCKSSTTTELSSSSTITSAINPKKSFVVFWVYAGLIITIFFCTLCFVYKRRKEAEKNKRNNETEEVRKSLLQIHVLDEENKNLEQSLHHRKQACNTEFEATAKRTISKETSESANPLVRSSKEKYTMLKDLHGDGAVFISKNNKYPLYIARESGRLQWLTTDNGNDKWFGLAYVACKNGYSDIVYRILNTDEYGNIHFSNQEESSLVSVACKNGHYNVVRLLLKYGVDVNFCNENGASPLYMACFNGHTNTVRLLLQRGANINLCSKGSISPLYVACQNEYKIIVHILLNNGADINLCDEYGASPLYVACLNRFDDIIQLLLEYGADINFCNVNGLNPLYVVKLLESEKTMFLP